MEGCIFCSISEGRLPAKVEYSDENVMVFRDINPQAPIHLLAIPRRHVESARELDDGILWGKLINALRQIAEKLGVDREGYRVVVNCGDYGGQQVSHLHAHLLAGRRMAWPPG